MTTAPATCQYCHSPACFQAQLAGAAATFSQPPLCTLSACGRHLTNMIDDLPRATHDHNLPLAHVTLLATDPAPRRPATTTRHLTSSLVFSHFTVPAA
jgi:hypothetical protein